MSFSVRGLAEPPKRGGVVGHRGEEVELQSTFSPDKNDGIQNDGNIYIFSRKIQGKYCRENQHHFFEILNYLINFFLN